MSDDKLKELTYKRSSIRGRVTKFKKHVDDLCSLESVSEIEISKLAMKLSKFEALFISFDELQSEIEVVNAMNQTADSSARDAIEQDFYHCIAFAQKLIETNSNSNPADIKSKPSHSVTSHCHHHDECSKNNPLGFKLPEIKIPKFDGSYFKWLEFKETFNALIHENDAIKNIHKFFYLNSYLENEARGVISNLEVTNSNYSQAWLLLCERYDNKRQLIYAHLKSLFNFETVRETNKSLIYIIDHVTKNLRALSTLGLPTDKWDVLVIFMLTTKLDSSTIFKWEEHRNNLTDIPTLNQFFSFLKSRADVFETVHRNKIERQDNSNNRSRFNNVPYCKNQSKALVMTSSGPKAPKVVCVVCQGSHRIYDCSNFKSKSHKERMSLVSSLNLCTNCLRGGHVVSRCRLPGTCRLCKQRHNTMLHDSPQNEATEMSDSIALSSISTSEVLLCTAEIQIRNPTTGKTLTIRALLDSGSQTSFITEEIKNKLNIKSQSCNTSLSGIGDTPIKYSAEICMVHIISRCQSFQADVSCLVLPSITSNIPKTSFDITKLNLLGFTLADPRFNQPASIQMLIGAEMFWKIIGSEQHHLGDQGLLLQSSKLGWLIGGPLPSKLCFPSSKQMNKSSLFCNFLLKENHMSNLHDKLEKFWQLESFPCENPFTDEEKLCEEHFTSNTTRLSNGRFCVALPLKDTPDSLGTSYNLAKKRFFNLEARFRKQPELESTL